MTTMSESLLRLHFLSILLVCCLSSSSFLTTDYFIDGLVPCGPLQTQVLTQFKNEFDSSSCNQTEYFNGARCDNMTGAIIKLQLPSGCFTGILNPNSSLFGFHQLRYLNLSYNNFISSSLPLEFGNLNKLEVLALSSNGFIGQVPSSFNSLSLLSKLDLSHNELTGGFPLVRKLSKLSFLKLSYNHFSGTLNPNSSLFDLRHLRYLSLASNNFSSSLPYEFGNLNRLEILNLYSNFFFGQVPPTISNLTQLTTLSLHHNNLIGRFPFVQNLTKLSRIDLHENNLTGTVPSSILTMPFLSYLDLTGNDFAGSIEFPNSSTSSRLESLYLGHNSFEGKILEPISKLITLEDLDLSYLSISTQIDFKLFSSLKSLWYLDISGNNISSASLRSDSYISLTLRELSMEQCGINEFPQIIKTLQKLDYLSIYKNKIKGKIPEWLWILPHLTLVDLQINYFNGFEGSTESLVNSSVQVLLLDGNSFEGAFPYLPLFINVISASYNKFTGEIPLSLCERSSLSIINLSYNNFTGVIPQCLSNLTFLILRKNNLEGSIPDTFYVGASLQTLDIGYNQLTGKLPRSLVHCSSLKFLGVDNNKINDMFPFLLKDLPNLQVLILSSNKFYGPLSLHHGPLGFPELRIFEMFDNKFTGSLSPDYFVNWKASSLSMNEGGGLYMNYQKNTVRTYYYTYTDYIDLHYKGLSMEQANILSSYAAIDLSGNLLEGQIPESIGLLKALIALNLSNNAFSGHIPLSLANFKEIESLDMSRNKLSGTIPQGLGSISFLAYINVSHNQLKGEIPQGTQITGQHKSCFEGNAGLCGLPLEESCFEAKAQPTQNHKQEEEEEDEEEQVLSWKAVVMGYGVGGLFGVAIAQFIASYKPEWLAKIIDLKKRRNR